MLDVAPGESLACVAPPAPPDTADSALPPDPTAGWVGGEGPTVTVSGRAFLFGPATPTTVSSWRRCRAPRHPYGGAGVGEPDAVVTVSPALPDDVTGPVYSDYLSDSLILPDPAFDATTIDGGVIFANVPTGEWPFHAQKEGVNFTEPVARCHPGAIVNAAPPHGVEVVEV